MTKMNSSSIISTIQTFEETMTAILSSNDTTPYDPYRGLSVDHAPWSAIAVIEGITMVIIFVGALFANLMAMTTILTDKVLRGNFHNVLVLNLTFMDLGVTITSMSGTIWSIYDHGYLLVHSEILCGINGFGATLFTFGNFTTILAISVDRYLTVCWSTRFPPTKCRAIALVVFCWALPIINVIPPSFEFLSDFRYHPDTHHCSPAWDACLYFIIWFTFIFGITVPIMAFCYVSVIRTIRCQELQLRSHARKGKSGALSTGTTSDSGVVNISMGTMSSSNGNLMEGLSDDTIIGPSDGVWTGEVNDVCGATAEARDANVGTDQRVEMAAKSTWNKKKRAKKILVKLDKLSVDKRVAITGILLVMTTLICWTPYFIIHSCFIPIDPPHWLGVVSMWLGYTNSLLDPLVYSFMNRRVRARYRSLIGFHVDCALFRAWLVRCFGRSGEE